MKVNVCSCINQCPQCGMCCQNPCPHRGGGQVTYTDTTLPKTTPLVVNPVEPEEFRINAAFQRGYERGFNDGFTKGDEAARRLVVPPQTTKEKNEELGKE